uniref:Peptidase M50 n=2 Tax=Pseudoalteromonas rubra TaxID=43658 RepID=A0A0F4QVV7_9GAMM|nr:hypothetical protein TW77_06045 [Pseudoalteromonas rubra]
MVLVSTDKGASVRVSAVAKQLLPILYRGANFSELSEHLRKLHPTARDIDAKLHVFLTQLSNAGLLENSEKKSRVNINSPKIRLLDLDPGAKLIAEGIKSVPRVFSWFMLAALLGLSCLVLLWMIVTGQLPAMTSLVDRFHIAGVAIFVLLVVPLHEFSHAIATRLAGIKAGYLGVVVHNGFVPGPYIETPEIYQLKSKISRFWIPAAGPIIDFLAVGFSGAMILWGPQDPVVQDIFVTLFFISLMFVYFDTNPITPSDGSHMLEALFDDELARVSALSFKRATLSAHKTVAAYRVIASMHLQLAVFLLYLWWS